MTNPNYGESATNKFQPMPKRFMVWNKTERRFNHNIDDNSDIFTPAELAVFLSNRAYNGINLDEYVIIQSTNHFDKDSKEIFEGSLISWNKDVGVVEQRNGKWVFHISTPAFGVYHELGPNADIVKNIGHILSNPELLEEE